MSSYKTVYKHGHVNAGAAKSYAKKKLLLTQLEKQTNDNESSD